MEFHFVKLNVNGTYLSLVDPTSKPRFICFSNHETAGKCVKYVAHPPKVYGIDTIDEVASTPHAFRTWKFFLVHFKPIFPAELVPIFRPKLA